MATDLFLFKREYFTKQEQVVVLLIFLTLSIILIIKGEVNEAFYQGTIRN